MSVFDKWFSNKYRSCACCGKFPDVMQSTDSTARLGIKAYDCLEELSKESTDSPYCETKTLRCKVCGVLWKYELWGVGHRDFDWRLTILREPAD
jgi:hypothetical protein